MALKTGFVDVTTYFAANFTFVDEFPELVYYLKYVNGLPIHTP
jgi:hypothetical protein